MMDDPSGRPPAGGVARRRRERRLRAQLRHEQQTVRMVLATVTHHSFQVGTAHDGLRAQKTVTSTREVEERVPHAGLRAQTAPPPGVRPGLPLEPGPQRSDRTVRHSSGDSLPQLAMPSLAGAAGEAVDSATLAFLLSQSLAAKEHEEQKKREEEARKAHAEWRRRRKKLKAEFLALLDLPSRTPTQHGRMLELADLVDEMDASKPGTSSASSSGRKKKKKRRKRRRRRRTCRC